ncbi:UBX domain-containing protein 11-like [Dysidea avara]|uniref:UBX domain-containing protein 11-like n=1 Tax=Dysidea avara TaxID=196820 RepID=UPI0033195BD5
MSGPESTLKKTKRAPLPGGKKRPVPFRSTPAVPNTTDELDSITRQFIVSELRRTTKGTASNDVTGKNNISDNDIVATMATRLGQVEQELLSARKEIIEKDQHIRHLEERLSLLEHDRTSDATSLQEKCLSLQEQVTEMEEFLADYGMVWVGGGCYGDYDDNDVGVATATWNPASSYIGDDVINYDLIIDNVKELNLLAGEDTARVSRDQQGAASLKVMEPVSLTLYHNGIILYDGPFRPFTDPSTMQCVKDLQDGYFPSELKARHPDGVPLKVNDMRDTIFKSRQYGNIFPGTGHHLGGKKAPSRLLPSTKQARDGGHYKETSDRPTLPVGTFLSRLPQSVVRKGKIIDVRNGVQNALQGDDNTNVILADTPAIEEIKNRLHSADGANRSPQQYCTLRVTSETGDQTIVLKMRPSDTIDELRCQLDKTRSAQGVCHQDYTIHSRFPNRTFTRGGDTLAESGLCPSANLFLHSKHSIL